MNVSVLRCFTVGFAGISPPGGSCSVRASQLCVARFHIVRSARVGVECSGCSEECELGARQLRISVGSGMTTGSETGPDTLGVEHRNLSFPCQPVTTDPSGQL